MNTHKNGHDKGILKLDIFLKNFQALHNKTIDPNGDIVATHGDSFDRFEYGKFNVLHLYIDSRQRMEEIARCLFG